MIWISIIIVVSDHALVSHSRWWHLQYDRVAHHTRDRTSVFPLVVLLQAPFTAFPVPFGWIIGNKLHWKVSQCIEMIPVDQLFCDHNSRQSAP